MRKLAAPIPCTVCYVMTESVYANRVLLGTGEQFCFFCFLEWYENGIVNEEVMRRRSLQQRYIGMRGEDDGEASNVLR